MIKQLIAYQLYKLMTWCNIELEKIGVVPLDDKTIRTMDILWEGMGPKYRQKWWDDR